MTLTPSPMSIAVTLLHDLAQMYTNAELDAAVMRQADIALDHAALDFERTTHSVDHASEFNDDPVARALNDAALMHGDGRVDQVTAQSPQSRERAVLVRTPRQAGRS